MSRQKRVSELEDRKLDIIQSGSRKEKTWESVNRTHVTLLGCHNSIRPSGLNNKYFFSQFRKVALQDQDIGRVDFFWASPWLAFDHLLTVSLHDISSAHTSSLVS